MAALDDLTSRIVAFRNARDWKQFHNPKDMAISLMLEAELLELFQWKSDKQVRRHEQAQKRRIAEELADVQYWVLLISHDLGISIVESLSRKMKQNEENYPVSKSRGKATKYTDL
jgi:dCTP diphosphatase